MNVQEIIREGRQNKIENERMRLEFEARAHFDGLRARRELDRKRKEEMEAANLEWIIASQTGNLTEIKRLRTESIYWGGEVCSIAAANGHLELLKWARANGCPWNKEECLRVSACHDDVNNWIINCDAKKTRDTDEVRELRKQVADLTHKVESMGKERKRCPRKP